jgi:uncharacterized protein YbbK (DUF523 family)
MKKILVSACLTGERVRYDGKSAPLDNSKFMEWKDKGGLVTFCPEMEGGLLVPRTPAEIVGGSGYNVLEGKAWIINSEGNDMTMPFIKGAERCLNLIKRFHIKYALLKEKSPSCGSHWIYDGTFNKNRIPGAGVTTALLAKNNVRIFSENEIYSLTETLNHNF